MKTRNQFETQVTEEGISARIQHRYFVDQAKNTHRFKKRRMDRTIGAVEERIVQLLKIEDYLLDPKLSLQPEFIAYTFHLDGVPRKLLMYILFYELDTKTCRFKFDAQMVYRFHEFCGLFGGKHHPDDVVTQAKKRLVKMNIMISVDRGKYMINPLVNCESNHYRRTELINEYCKYLIDKGKNPSTDFYPRYTV